MPAGPYQAAQEMGEENDRLRTQVARLRKALHEMIEDREPELFVHRQPCTCSLHKAKRALEETKP